MTIANKIAWVAPRCGVQKRVLIIGGEISLEDFKESGTHPGFTHLSASTELGIFVGLVFFGFIFLTDKILAAKAK